MFSISVLCYTNLCDQLTYFVFIQNSQDILSENKDAYMINPCSASIWFIVELCELVSVRSLEIASFELFKGLLNFLTLPQEDASAYPEEARYWFQDEHESDISGEAGVRGDPGSHGGSEGRQGRDTHLRRSTSLYWEKTLHKKSRTRGKIKWRLKQICGIKCFVCTIVRCSM